MLTLEFQMKWEFRINVYKGNCRRDFSTYSVKKNVERKKFQKGKHLRKEGCAEINQHFSFLCVTDTRNE